MLLDVIYGYSIWDISIVGVVVCFVLLTTAFLAIGRKGRGTPKQQVLEAGPVRGEGDPVRQIVEARIMDGVEASLSRCTPLENELVGQKASADPLDGLQELTSIENQLQFIRWYRSFHEYHKTHRIEHDETRQFIRHVNECLALDDDPYRELYKRLWNLGEAFPSSSFQQIISALAGAEMPPIRTRDTYFSCVLEVLQTATRASQKYQKADGTGDRNLRLEELRRALHQGAERLRRVDADNSARRLVPAEFTLLLSDISSVVVVVTEEARKATESPAFEITLTGDVAEIAVESRYLRLNFAIEDAKRIPGVETIFVTLRSQSSALSYSGEPVGINFENYIAEVGFTFDVYIFNQADYDSTPKVVFDITYVLFGVNASQSVLITLPKLIPKPVLKNPFRDGELGRSLPGDSKLFVGRHELLSEMAGELLETNAAFYWLHGLARTGKSSIINQLSGNRRWLNERYTPIQVNSQASQGPWAFFLNIYHLVKEAIDHGVGGSTAPDEMYLSKDITPSWRPVVELLRLNEALLRRQRRRLLFLIDEVQDIAKSDAPTTGSGKYADVWYQFPEFVKVLRDQYDSVTAVVVCGLWSLTDFDTINWNWTQQLGGRIEVRSVTNLLPSEADDLLLSQFKPYNIRLSDQVLSRVRKYTAMHPFLQVLMGYYLFERLSDDGQLRADRTISGTDVDVAARRIPADKLKFIWSDAWIRDNPELRLFLGALGQQSAEAGERNSDPTLIGSYSIDNLTSYLHETFQIQFPHLDFQAVIGDLYGQQIIADVGQSDKRFQLRYPLFALACAQENLIGRFVREWREKRLTQ